MSRYKFPKGYTPWNKGLTKETDKRLTRTEKYKNSISGKGNPFYGKKHTIESKKKICENHWSKKIKNSWSKKGKDSPNYGKKLSSKTKKKISVARMGKKHSEETKEKIRKIRAKQIFPINDTSIEVKIQEYLKLLNIDFFTHQYIKEIEHGYQCDILIPSMNLVIECDGDYWHKYPIGREIDHIRTKELLEKGFKVLRLWEHEIKAMNLNEFKEKLK